MTLPTPLLLAIQLRKADGRYRLAIRLRLGPLTLRAALCLPVAFAVDEDRRA